MLYLFSYAHPDDESYGAAGTIAALTKRGDEVIVVSATDGSAGEITFAAQDKLSALGSLGALRKLEFKEAVLLLGAQPIVLDFKDGEITNQQVWSYLTDKYISLIEYYKPDVVITFDHSGWYFHLDHIAVSIAMTRAFNGANHQPKALLFNMLRSFNTNPKWKYVFPNNYPITHNVDIAELVELKLSAIKCHLSQELWLDYIKDLTIKENLIEEYQLIRPSRYAQELFSHHPIFKALP